MAMFLGKDNSFAKMDTSAYNTDTQKPNELPGIYKDKELLLMDDGAGVSSWFVWFDLKACGGDSTKVGWREQ